MKGGLQHRRGQLSLEGARVMGILNVTPDSFSDGGRHYRVEDAVRTGLQMVEQGADILDIGGESTRPGAAPVEPEEEARRVVPVIESLRDCGAVLSVDTRRARVAEEALSAGADLVNDVSGGADPGMFGLVAGTGAGLVLMHMRGEPGTMQHDTHYENLVGEVCAHLLERASAARENGVEGHQICLDPGIGFGKSAEGNLELLNALPRMCDLGYPVLVGASRKSFLGKIFGHPLGERLGGSLAVALHAQRLGARILRVHDVLETRQALDVQAALNARGGN